MTTYITGEFRAITAAAAAIRSLRATGISSADLDLFSEEPAELPRGLLDRPGRMSLAAVSGAILFGLLSTSFIWWTQHDYKLVTGGMPIFSFWATGVIVYEMIMLGAIVATFAWFLRESGLLRRRDPNEPIPQVDPGVLCLRVRCTADQAAQATDQMRRAGAIHVERRSAA